MRILPLAVIAGAFALGPCVSAQDNHTPKPPYTFETMLERIRGDNGATDGANARNCVVRDNTQLVPLNGTLTVRGRTYRCVEVLDQKLQPRGVAWTPGSKPAYTSEAMLRRIAGGGVPTTSGAESINCVLADNTQHPVNMNAAVGGRTYQCVEVLDRNLEQVGAAWTPLPPRP